MRPLFAAVARAVSPLEASVRAPAPVAASRPSDTSRAVPDEAVQIVEMEESLRLANDAGRALERTLQGAEETVDRVHQIAASEEQSATSEQIAHSVETISSATETSARRLNVGPHRDGPHRGSPAPTSRALRLAPPPTAVPA